MCLSDSNIRIHKCIPMTHFDFNSGRIEKEQRFSDKYFMDGNFLFEDLMDDFPDAVTSGLNSRSVADDELDSDGLYEGEDELPCSINVKYENFYGPVAKVQGIGKTYEKIIESFKSL